jgi:phenylpyruvate tautomerase PptA (4-oxalocrotonate tautomerase family)
MDALDLNENPSATIVIPSEVRTNDDPDPSYAGALCRIWLSKLGQTHKQLKKDLIEHICQRYGNKEN